MKKMIHLTLFMFFSATLFCQWTVEYDPFRTNPYYISVVDTGTIWCLGYKTSWWDTVEVMTKTPEYGWEWGNGNDLPVNIQYLCIGGINSTTAFIGDIQGHIYKTTNYGWNWTNILNAGSDYNIVDIKFSKVNRNSGYIFCSKNDYSNGNTKIYRTNDFGNSWQLYTQNFGNYIFSNKPSVWVTDSLHAWIALWCLFQNCPTTKIALTTNGGVNWNTSDVESQRTGNEAVAFSYDNQFGFTSTYKIWTPSRMFSSNNGGINWNYTDTVYPGNILSLITVPNSSDWYMSGQRVYPDTTWEPYLLKSSNNGLNWVRMYSQDSSNVLLDMEAINLNGKIYAYATCTGKVMKLVDTANVIGIENEGNLIPLKYNLFQNFPNPFNPATVIKYDLPKDVKVTVKVYDILGKEIATLVNNEFKNAGRYEINWNAGNYASGVYIYRIEAGDFISTKKMVLIK